MKKNDQSNFTMLIKAARDNVSVWVNIVIFCIGLIIVVVGGVFTNGNILTIMLSIGCSLIATACVSMLTLIYMIKHNDIKQIIETWKLQNIFESKSEMNVLANQLLCKSKNNVDILATGMTNYRTNQRKVLETKIKNGVSIRIITCMASAEIMNRKELDEGISQATGIMQQEVKDLFDWVKKMKEDYPQNKLEIKYHKSYPAFSYLRIDDSCFWSPNLYLNKSQGCIAWLFKKDGLGFDYFDEHFETLWESEDFVYSEMSENTSDSDCQKDTPIDLRIGLIEADI